MIHSLPIRLGKFIKLRKYLLFGLFYLMFSLGNEARGGPKTWTGSTSTNWNIGANWSGGVVPASGDDALIPGGLSRYPLISNQVTIKTISINNTGTGASVTVTAGGSLTSNDLIIVNTSGTFTVAGGTVTTNDLTINGTFSMTGGLVKVEHDFKGTGTFSMTSGLFQIGHDYKPSTPGNFVCTGGTVEFIGAAGGKAFEKEGTYRFFNVIVDVTDPGFENKTANIFIISGNLSIKSGATLVLPNNNNSTASTLTLGGVAQVPGTWGGTKSSATNKNLTYFGSVSTGLITVSQGAADAAQSTMTPTAASITADGTSTQVLTVQARDVLGNNLSTGGSTVTIIKSSGPGTISAVTDQGNGTYTATVTSPTATGSGVFVATLDGSPVKSGGANQTQSTITYIPGAVNNFLVESAGGGYIPNQTAGVAFTIKITARDANNNICSSGANLFAGTVNITSTGSLSSGSGTTASFTAGVLSSHTVTISPGGSVITITATSTGGSETGTSNSFNVNNPTPSITSITPSTRCAGDSGFSMTIIGSGFNTSSVVFYGGSARSTTFITSSQLTAAISATDIATGGTYNVTVQNPLPGGGTSNIAALMVTARGSWTGTTNTDWNTASNWTCSMIPDLNTDVQIPNVANKPVLSTGAAGTSKNITIESGSSLTVTGNTLQIAGTLANNGTFTASAGTIDMKGSSTQLIGANVFANNRILNLTVNNPAGVTLQGPLDITGIVFPNTGNLSSQGNLTLISTASQTALIDGSGAGTVQGNVTIQRYLPAGYGYKYISSPVQSATVNELADDLDLAAAFPVFYSYDEDNHSDSAGISRYSTGWVKYLSGTLEPMKGYAANFGSSTNPKTIDITGVVNNNISASLTLFNHNRLYTKGFNLVGNPYPCPIDWDAASGWTRNNIDNAIYYFDAGSTQYTGTYSTYINGTSSNGFADGEIAAMQGFFVHVSDGTYPVTGTLGMTNAVRINNLNPNFHKSAGQNFRPLIRLSAGFEDEGPAADPTVVYFDELATTGFNRECDALKMLNTDEQVPSLYSVADDHRWLSINGIPYRGDTLSVIPLGIQTLKPGWVEFKAADIENLPVGMHVYLHDSETGMNQDMQQSLRYRAYLLAGEHINRFWLKLSLIDLAEMPASKNSFFAFCSGDDLRVKLMLGPDEDALLSVCNLMGQVVWRLDVSGMGYSEVSQALSTGIYVVSLYRSTGIQSQKVYVPYQ